MTKCQSTQLRIMASRCLKGIIRRAVELGADTAVLKFSEAEVVVTYSQAGQEKEEDKQLRILFWEEVIARLKRVDSNNQVGVMMNTKVSVLNVDLRLAEQTPCIILRKLVDASSNKRGGKK
jgi:hypothetical protein